MSVTLDDPDPKIRTFYSSRLIRHFDEVHSAPVP